MAGEGKSGGASATAMPLAIYCASAMPAANGCAKHKPPAVSGKADQHANIRTTTVLFKALVHKTGLCICCLSLNGQVCVHQIMILLLPQSTVFHYWAIP
jgi:hypothetical protein